MTLALIALGVAMDATAVSAGYALRGLDRTRIVLLALVFGAFQLVMALVGAVGGRRIENLIGRWDHWIALVLLTIVGGRMIHEAFETHEDERPVATLSLAGVLALGIATSIDSLAVGLTLPTIGLPIVRSAVVIGAVTAACSLGGAWLGARIGERFGQRVEVLGGLILIAIGIKVVVDHTTG